MKRAITLNKFHITKGDLFPSTILAEKKLERQQRSS